MQSNAHSMKIFISWSGNRSRVFAQEFAIWIRCVIQAARPWISTDDIPGGSNWFNLISTQLSATSTGIICLTKENFRNEWIMFESGALFKGLPSSRLYTILIDLDVGDIVNSPLTQINHTKTTQTQIKKLVHDLNREMGELALDTPTLDTVFEMYWQKFEELLAKAMAEKSDEKQEKANEVSAKDMLAEVLSSIKKLHVEANPGESGLFKIETSAIQKRFDAAADRMSKCIFACFSSPSAMERENLRQALDEFERVPRDQLDEQRISRIHHLQHTARIQLG